MAAERADLFAARGQDENPPPVVLLFPPPAVPAQRRRSFHPQRLRKRTYRYSQSCHLELTRKQKARARAERMNARSRSAQPALCGRRDTDTQTPARRPESFGEPMLDSRQLLRFVYQPREPRTPPRAPGESVLAAVLRRGLSFLTVLAMACYVFWQLVVCLCCLLVNYVTARPERTTDMFARVVTTIENWASEGVQPFLRFELLWQQLRDWWNS